MLASSDQIIFSQSFLAFPNFLHQTFTKVLHAFLYAVESYAMSLCRRLSGWVQYLFSWKTCFYCFRVILESSARGSWLLDNSSCYAFDSFGGNPKRSPRCGWFLVNWCSYSFWIMVPMVLTVAFRCPEIHLNQLKSVCSASLRLQKSWESSLLMGKHHGRIHVWYLGNEKPFHRPLVRTQPVINLLSECWQISFVFLAFFSFVISILCPVILHTKSCFNLLFYFFHT